MNMKKHGGGYLIAIDRITEAPQILSYLSWTRYMVTKLRTPPPTGDTIDEEAPVLTRLVEIERILRCTIPGLGNSLSEERVYQRMQREKNIRVYYGPKTVAIGVSPAAANLFMTMLPKLNLPDLAHTLDRRMPGRMVGIPSNGPFMTLLSYLSYGRSDAGWQIPPSIGAIFLSLTRSFVDIFTPDIDMKPFTDSAGAVLASIASSRKVTPTWLQRYLNIKG